MTAVEQFMQDQPVRRPGTITQTTAVEQSRAVAEVQAAVTVALQFPRDMARAYAEMKAACGRLQLAKRAFYSVPNRGNGPSVHLARELARIWGNIDYGVRELSRDDAAAMSEVQAFAWDQQVNVRSSRTFQAPHAKMKGRNREVITDLDDIYRNNQNVGAKAVRETIFTILPAEFVEEAQNLCRATLEHGDGIPVPQRIEMALASFASINVSQERLEAKLGKPRGQWGAQQVADMGIWYTSITRDGIDAASLLPEVLVMADELDSRPSATRGAPAVEDGTPTPMGAVPEPVGEVGSEQRLPISSTGASVVSGVKANLRRGQLTAIEEDFTRLLGAPVDAEEMLWWAGLIVAHPVSALDALETDDLRKLQARLNRLRDRDQLEAELGLKGGE